MSYVKPPSWDIEEFISQYNDYENNQLVTDVADALGISERTVRTRAQWIRENIRDHGLIIRSRNDGRGNVAGFAVSTADAHARSRQDINNDGQSDPSAQELGERLGFREQQLQRSRDLLRMTNKALREDSRRQNVQEELNQRLIELLEARSFHTPREFDVNPDAPVGVVHLSDIHFNERVDLPVNQYNWEIAGARIYKHIQTAKRIFKASGVTEVLVAMTGDLMNSDRRLDEVLMNVTNRTYAMFQSTDILQQAICDLNEDFNVSVANVCGNEARVGKDIGYIQPIASENYDQAIFLMLHRLLADRGIRFNLHDDPSECVVNVNGQNLLLVHGHAGVRGAPFEASSKFRAKYSDYGVKIDYVIWGHIHEAYISDNFARSGSPVGNNDYSAKALNLSGRASQNLYLFHKDGSRDGIKVDLQSVDVTKRYYVDPDLYAYNSKSLGKIMNHVPIFQVVV